MIDAEDIVDFWFALAPADWWGKDENLDCVIAKRFGNVHQRAARGELWQWRKTTLGRLAEIIILDQFSRQLYREDARAFAQDALALVLAQEAVASVVYREELSAIQQAFLYMPFMHSESAVIHEEAVRLYKSLGLKEQLAFEMKHKVIIDRFGRYPHRNAILGRCSTERELEFLAGPDSSF